MKMAELLPLRVYPFTLEIPELSMSQKNRSHKTGASWLLKMNIHEHGCWFGLRDENFLTKVKK